ncbi:MAG: Cache 3/Cache 2 fusion domain-containing protein, partial [Planctomycetota bacterium]|nr:Cache 3/Cache 2 fusion domain-containing protein [Planctomycetota bacterium]
MTLTLRTKISGLALLAGVLPVLVLVVLVTTEQQRVSKEVTGEMNLISQQSTRRIALDVWNMCRLAHETVLRQVQATIKGVREQLASHGPVQVSSADKVSWEAKNQVTGAVSPVTLPKLMFGPLWLGQNSDPKTPTPVVDEMGRVAGTSVSVFQRMNEDGDMLRVATNVETAGRSRPLSTYLPARGADGSSNPILAKVLKGQPYCGLSVLNDTTYIAAYEPLNDERGQLVGMLAVGVPLDSMKLLRSAILETKVGRDGYVYVLKGTGAQRGTYVISSGGQQDGVNIWERTD